MTPPPVTEGPRLPPALEPVEGPIEDDIRWVEVERTEDLLDVDGLPADVADVEIVASRMRGCSFVGAHIERLRMTDVVVDGCDLSGVELYEADLTRVAFTSCRLSGANLARARFADVSFIGCKADGLNLRMVRGARLATTTICLPTSCSGA